MNKPLTPWKAVAALGGYENFVALFAEGLANENLAFTLRVHVRGVVEIYPRVEGGVEGPERCRPATIAGEQPTNAGSAKSNFGNVPPGLPKLSMAHAGSPSPGFQVVREVVCRTCGQGHNGQRGVFLSAGREATGIDYQKVRDFMEPIEAIRHAELG